MAAATTLPNAFVYEGELQRFFRSRESELGIRSNMGAQVNALLSGGGTHASHDFDHAMVDLLDRNKTIGVFRAVWSALAAMERAGFRDVEVCRPFRSRSQAIQRETWDMFPDLSLIVEGSK